DLDVGDVYLGNGVSELITMTMQALCNPEDEILIPSPDYPLWTGSVALAGGVPVHYLADESQDWAPDFEDLEAKITPRTRAIGVINPNDPTGAVCPREALERFVDLARKHDLILLADEIYEKIVYDGAEMINLATLTGKDVLCLTYS
ncbi:aminotransferase class I/II-fold pyridoxal phosphate-dependent enzyme, partial [Escherichia coli]|uniref:aminotransferase class I/II-fold pyridoxal phosphate-dependent enzyme n=1 Tax=Escherichia coli TaxID=562 RepID=UPI0011CB8487